MSATPGVCPERARKMPASESMVVWLGGTGRLSSHIMMLSGWSTKLWPIPGIEATTGIPREDSWEDGPMPEWRSRRGVSIAPAQRIVSLRAARVREVPDWRVIFTPVTVEFVTLTRLTQASVRMVRLGLCSSPRRMGWM